MKFKRILSLLLVLIISVSFSACNTNSTKTPESTIETLFNGLVNYDIEIMTQALDSFPNADDCAVTYNPFSDQAYIQLYQAAYENVSYTILSQTATDSAATIKLSVSHPDLKSSYTAALYSAMALALSNEDLFNEVMSDDAKVTGIVPTQIKNMYTNGNVDTIISEVTLQLKKEGDAWKIISDEQLKNLLSSNLYQIASNTDSIFNTEEN